MGGVERIVLIGFSGSGKTTVAAGVADQLGWTAFDTDAAIEREQGKSIPAIFRDDGEAAFRAAERAALVAATARDRVVIATGGGAVARPDAWLPNVLGRPGTLVVALDAAPATLLSRLRAQAEQEGEAVERPMLAGADPLGRIASLKQERQSWYDAAHLSIGGGEASLDEVIGDVVAVAGALRGEPLAVRLEAASGASEILVGPGILASLGDRTREQWPRARRAWVVSDENVAGFHGAAAVSALEHVGVEVRQWDVAPGESSKSLPVASELYDWMLGGGIERGDVVVALGGGVVGDLAGFAAATVLRGVGLVQVPTSLLAAVDSSVGGKTGINHATGKNLIGAFLQPQLVVADTTLLQTLPAREFRSGWAEVVKHAVIQRSTPGGERDDLAMVLRRNGRQLTQLDDPALAYLIWRNIKLKAAVVAADEREAGVRAYLNFGHTLGHAVEAADYELLHGEAVALGMRAAAEIGVSMDTCHRRRAIDINELLDAFGLPSSAPFTESRVLELLQSDKKRVAGRQRYVLPAEPGGVEIRDDVPDSLVRSALATINAAATVV